VVVLDLWLEGDAAAEGAGSLDLLEFYRSTQTPVIALDHGAERDRSFPDQRVTVLAWPPDPGVLRASVLAAFSPGVGPGPLGTGTSGPSLANRAAHAHR